MHLTLKLMLKVSNDIEVELTKYERVMKHEIYRIAGVFNKTNNIFEFRYKYISNEVSWHSKAIVLRKAKELHKSKDEYKNTVMSFSSIWNSKSYQIIKSGIILLELGNSHNREKLIVPFYINEQQMRRIDLGILKEMTIKKQGTKWIAYVCLEISTVSVKGNESMGIDLGIKVPAVVFVSDGSVKFFGNGRQIRYVQRSYRKKIQIMQKKKQLKKLRKFEHRLSHKLMNFDHQISKQIIRFASDHNVSCIVMERLTSICKKFNVEKNQYIYLWSYRRLQNNIAYKASLAGIKVVYVNPYNTSKRCPSCSFLNTARDRMYKCLKCGYHGHRDMVGAINILYALDSCK